MAPPVGVELVEHQVAKALRPLHERPVSHPSEDQLEHHIVGEEDVRRRLDDGPASFVALLSGVALKGHRRLTAGCARDQELLELLGLAVGQGVHGIDDDGLDPAPAARAQYMVDDGHEVGQALARAGPGGQHIVAPGPCLPDGVDLMAVEAHGKSTGITADGLAGPEDVRAPLMEEPLGHQVIDPATRLEGGVEPDARLGPQRALVQAGLDPLTDAPVAKGHEAGHISAVVVDQPVTQVEDVHRTPLSTRRWGHLRKWCDRSHARQRMPGWAEPLLLASGGHTDSSAPFGSR